MTNPFTTLSCACYPELKEGYAWSHIIAQIFGDCIYTPRELLSFSFGLFTLVLNVVSLLPQILLNYKNKKTEGLSIGLLVIWIFADIAALIGCYLTDQLITQKLLAIYFLIIDSVTIFQCWYYGTTNDFSEGGNNPLNVSSSSSTFGSSKEDNSTYISDLPLEQYVVSYNNHQNNKILAPISEANNNINNNEQKQQQNEVMNTSYSYQAGLTSEFQPMDSNNSNVNDDDFETLLLDENTSELSPLFKGKSPSKNNNKSEKNEKTDTRVSNSSIAPAIAIVSMISLCLMIALTDHTTTSSSPTTLQQAPTKVLKDLIVNNLPSCLYQPELSENVIFIGVIISWLSGFLYCLSRVPQILSNQQLSKLNIPLDGLSPSVFAITALGNIFYGGSVLLRVQIDAEFWYKTFPYLLGSLGTLVFDAFILYQIYIYNKRYNDYLKYNLGGSSRFSEDEY